MQQGGGEPRRNWDGTGDVIGACIEVHRHLGPGLLESTYEHCLCHELALRNLPFERQVVVPVRYKDTTFNDAYRLDIIVAGRIIVEVKSVEHLLPVHAAQVITYLKLTGAEVALLVNFNVRQLRHGLRRFVQQP